MMARDDATGQLVIDDAVGSGTITHVAPEVLLGEWRESLWAAANATMDTQSLCTRRELNAPCRM